METLSNVCTTQKTNFNTLLCKHFQLLEGLKNRSMLHEYTAYFKIVFLAASNLVEENITLQQIIMFVEKYQACFVNVYNCIKFRQIKFIMALSLHKLFYIYSATPLVKSHCN